MPSPVVTTQGRSLRSPPRAPDHFIYTGRTERIGDSRERQELPVPKGNKSDGCHVKPPVSPAVAACRRHEQEQSVSKQQRNEKKLFSERKIALNYSGPETRTAT